MHKDCEEHMKYLYAVAVEAINLEHVHRRKIKKMRAMSNKYQIRLAKQIKRTMCMKCSTVMIPGVNSVSRILRRENGLCLATKCRCGIEKVIVMRGR
jgi:ribonuclease P protein subunit RPR2